MEAVGDVSPSSDTGFIGAPSIILETGLPVTACTIGVEQKRKRKTEVKGFSGSLVGLFILLFCLFFQKIKQVHFRNKVNKLANTFFGRVDLGIGMHFSWDSLLKGGTHFHFFVRLQWRETG